MDTVARVPLALNKAPSIIGTGRSRAAATQFEQVQLLKVIDALVSKRLISLEELAAEKRLTLHNGALSSLSSDNRSHLNTADASFKYIEGDHRDGTVFALQDKQVPVAPEHDFFIKFIRIANADQLMELVVALTLTLTQQPNCAQLYNWYIVDFGFSSGAQGDFTALLPNAARAIVRTKLAKEHSLKYDSIASQVFKEKEVQAKDGRIVTLREQVQSFYMWFGKVVRPFCTLVLVTQNAGDVALHEMYESRVKHIVSRPRSMPELNTYYCGLLAPFYAKPTDFSGVTLDTTQVRLRAMVAYVLHTLQKFQDDEKFIHLDMHSSNVRSQHIVPYAGYYFQTSRSLRVRNAQYAPYTMLARRPTLEDAGTSFIEWSALDNQEYTVIDFGFAQVSRAHVQQQLNIQSSQDIDTLKKLYTAAEKHKNRFHPWYDVFRFAFFMFADVCRRIGDYWHDSHQSFVLADFQRHLQNNITVRVLEFICAVMNPPAAWMHVWETNKKQLSNYAKYGHLIAERIDSPTHRKILYLGRTTSAISMVLSYFQALRRLVDPSLAITAIDQRVLASYSTWCRLYFTKCIGVPGQTSAFDNINQYFNKSLSFVMEQTDTLSVQMQIALKDYNAPENVRQWSWFIE